MRYLSKTPKQRSNVAAAIVENFDTAEKALEAMENPDVTALEELDKINESLEGRITKLGSSFEKLSNTFINKNGLKSAVSLFTDLLNKVTNLTDKIGGLGVAVEAFFMFKALRGGGALNLQRSLMTSSGFDLSIGSNLPLKALMNNMKDATGLRGKMNAVFNKSLISEADINGISLYNHYVSSGVSAQEALNKTRNLMSTNAASVVKNTIKQAEAMQKQTGETQKAIVATEQLNIITKQGTLLQRVGSSVGSFVGKVSSMALSMGTTMLVMAAINKLIEFVNKEKEAMKATAEATDEFNKQNKGLNELRKNYIEICTSITDETEKTKALNEWKKTLAETYGVEEEALKNINGTRKDGIDLINKESLAQKQRFLAENSKAGKSAESYVTSSPFVDLKSQGLFSKSAKTEREVYPKYLETLKGLYSETEDNRITFVEKMKQLEEELVSKQITEGVTWESNEFLGLLRKDIEHFEEKLKDKKYKEIFEGFIDAEMSVKADAIKDNLKYLDIYKRTLSDMNIIVQEIAASKMDGGEEYYDSLLNRANQYGISIEDLQEAYSIFGDKRELDSMQIKAFSDALKDLGVDINLMPNSTDEFISRLVALENELDEAKNKIQSLTSSIETARDSIKDISDIIDKQAEPDFFFDSTEMSEVLTKYPELQGHILECAYGYRIEENALNNLKQTKLEEQKIALQTTLDEQIAVYNSVQNKLNSYNAELNGIKTLTDAKIRMAEIDSALNKVSSNPLIVPAGKNIISGKLNKEKETLQEYVDIQNAMEKTKNALLTSQTQIDMLGKSFEDVKKATDNINKNMEKVKKSTQDSIDDMKDAKQSIEDLLELTIEMIKKQKELEKEALEEQLDGFKAIIENKKKQLEIEKDIYNFQKDLNEKNTSISDIKKDLDNLSLDDSLEAQKKKAELEEQLAKEQSKLDDFLYEHEVETRKNALDEEEKLFEEKIDGQIKTIEEYLNKEGVIRQDAMNLINSRTQQLYNDLQNYATTYSKYTEAEFIKLWTTAYDYLTRYGNGQIDISYSLSYLTGQTEYLTKYIEQLEVQADNATNALENLGNVDLTRVVTQLDGLTDAANTAIEAQAKATQGYQFFSWSDPLAMYNYVARQPRNHKYWSTPNLKAYHDGGVVTGGNEVSTGSSEIIAKLLKGEVVLNSRMQRNFFNKVIPDVYKAGAEYVTNNNSSNNPITIQQGDIIIQGNTDKSTVSEIQSKMQETINKTLAKINDSKRKFGGMPNAIGY